MANRIVPPALLIAILVCLSLPPTVGARAQTNDVDDVSQFLAVGEKYYFYFVHSNIRKGIVTDEPQENWVQVKEEAEGRTAWINLDNVKMVVLGKKARD